MNVIKKHKGFFVLAGVLLVEAVATVLMAPTRKMHAGHADAEPKAAELVEVPIGDFVVNNAIDPERPFLIRCAVMGTVSLEKKVALEVMLKSHQQRLRESISTVLRQATPEQVADSGLAAIRRQIHDQWTAIAGERADLVEHVIIPDFRVTDL